MDKKKVLVFGGAGALGKSVTQAFLDKGADVAVGYNALESWQKAEPEIVKVGGKLLALQVDVTNEESVRGFVAEVKEQFGAIDTLIYLAGAFFIGPPTWATETSVFRNLMEVNTIGAFTACRYVIPSLLESGKGNIIFMPAKSAVVGTPHFGAYATSKGALLTLMESLNEELKESDIAVNCVMPDAIITPKTLAAPGANPDKWVSTQQVAEVITSICYSEGNIIRGSVLKCFGK